MKLSVTGLVILIGASLAAAQKDPMLVRPRPNQHPASSQRSVSPEAVAVVLNHKSKTASDLAKIEHGPVNQRSSSKPATSTSNASVAKNFGVAQDNRNKPLKINASKPGGTGHTTYHPKKKTR